MSKDTHTKLNFDVAEKSRVTALWDQWRSRGSVTEDEIFLSRRVLEAIKGKKILLQSYTGERARGIIPFTKHVFTMTCPFCIEKQDQHEFAQLVSSGIIIPVLMGPYEAYPASLRSVIQANDHMSAYELNFFRTFMLASKISSPLCAHCFKERADKIREKITRFKQAPELKRYFDETVRSVIPPVARDYEILKTLEKAVQQRSIVAARQLASFSSTFASARLAEAFGSPLLVPDDKLEELAAYDLPEVRPLNTLSVHLRDVIVDGLGLKIPIDMPIDRYVNLIKEVRPQIHKVIDKLTGADGNGGEERTSLRKVFNAMRDVNREIERISKSTRYLLLDATVSAVRHNKDILAGVLTASALGLTGGAAACATGVAGATSVAVLRRLGRLKTSPSLELLMRTVHRDLEPVVNKLVAAYVGSTETSIQVMSLRRQIGEASKVVAVSTPSNSPHRGRSKIKRAVN